MAECVVPALAQLGVAIESETSIDQARKSVPEQRQLSSWVDINSCNNTAQAPVTL